MRHGFRIYGTFPGVLDLYTFKLDDIAGIDTLLLRINLPSIDELLVPFSPGLVQNQRSQIPAFSPPNSLSYLLHHKVNDLFIEQRDGVAGNRANTCRRRIPC